MSAVFDLLTLIAQVPVSDWREYCREHPPTRDTCRWCQAVIVSTPWDAPSGTVHLTGWIHEVTEWSSCGSDHPYRFAEPSGGEL